MRPSAMHWIFNRAPTILQALPHSVACVLTAWLLPAVCLGQMTPSETPTVRIGSKAFTESVVLGELLSHLARDAGAKVEHLAELGGTQILWNALQSGEIDAYVEYTGTIREEILRPKPGQASSADTEAQLREALA
ncbi:MAG: glycine betaine ABC transporter substrate-binding protein, partial [Pirellula sp.]